MTTDPSSNASLADAVERLAASVVGLASHRRGNAAGVVWRAGLVVTSAGAVWRADTVRVVLAGGEVVRAAVRGFDPSTDLALLALDRAGLVPVTERAEAPPRTGDAVFAVGREPSGLVHASFGRIGAAGGAWRTWRGGRVEQRIRLDGGLYPGLQGAAVGDSRGHWLGVASGSLSRHHGVVLPLATIDRVGALLLANGRITRGYLGVAAQPVALGAGAAAGLLISSVAEGSPASRAGVLVGDVIVTAAGQPVASIEALRDVLSADRVGARVGLGILRGGQPIELAAEVAEQPFCR
jgi:S1-C subfamily serine protease